MSQDSAAEKYSSKCNQLQLPVSIFLNHLLKKHQAKEGITYEDLQFAWNALQDHYKAKAKAKANNTNMVQAPPVSITSSS